jgi:hypothetical protein
MTKTIQHPTPEAATKPCQAVVRGGMNIGPDTAGALQE